MCRFNSLSHFHCHWEVISKGRTGVQKCSFWLIVPMAAVNIQLSNSYEILYAHSLYGSYRTYPALSNLYAACRNKKHLYEVSSITGVKVLKVTRNLNLKSQKSINFWYPVIGHMHKEEEKDLARCAPSIFLISARCTPRCLASSEILLNEATTTLPVSANLVWVCNSLAITDIHTARTTHGPPYSSV